MRLNLRTPVVPSAVFLVFAAALAAPASALAQCNEWDGGLFGRAGVGGTVNALVMYDDGAGPELVLGGAFAAAGNGLAKNVAVWDGSAFRALGAGLDSTVTALAVFDDGSGPALFAATTGSPRVSRWDGASWSAVGGGVGSSVLALEVFDDGSGPALFAGGSFTMAGGLAASRIARWDGSAWSAVGGGVNGTVRALAVFDDGGGAALHLGGDFTTAGGAAASRLARWDGAVYAPLGSGAGSAVRALAAADVGDGMALYVGGSFTSIGAVSANRIARWDGGSFSPLATGVDDSVFAIAAFDDGSGADLYVAGRMGTAGGVLALRIARWDGAAFSPVGSGAVSHVNALAVSGSGPGAVLYAGGELQWVGGTPSEGLGTWDGSAWSIPSIGMNGRVFALLEHDDGGGSGSALFAAGEFTIAGGAPASRVVKWDGSSFAPLGSGLDEVVWALSTFDDGSGPALYLGGDFTFAGGMPANRIARWDGLAFSVLGSGLGGNVSALEVFDDGSGPALYAAGCFSTAGGAPASRVARWDGAAWHPLGGGIGPAFDSCVYDLEVFDDGTGPALYAGGYLTEAGGQPAFGIARWDGLAWSAVGGGVTDAGEFRDPYANSLRTFDDGAGPALYVGGRFGRAGGVLSSNVARWTGSEWESLAGGLEDPESSEVLSLAIHDDGDGSQLFAALDGTVFRWSGTVWSPVSESLDGLVFDLASFDDGFGSSLFAGGGFATAGGEPSSYLARWGPKPSRAGNVDTGGGGSPADVLFLNGSPGDADCRRLSVAKSVPATVSLARPPAGGSGHYVFWILDGPPRSRDAAMIRYREGSGQEVDLGVGARCLPSNNLVSPGACPCPLAFPVGLTSKPLGAGTAAVLCVNSRPGFPRAPTSFSATFPAGTFTLGAVIVDPNSPNAKPVSIANWIVVDSL